MEKEVFILEETYKDGDPEVVGAYDSMRAMLIGLANRVSDECIFDAFGTNGKVDDNTLKAVKSTARACALMIPSILHCEFSDDECRIGQTVYGYSQMPIEGDGEDEEGLEDG